MFKSAEMCDEPAAAIEECLDVKVFDIVQPNVMVISQPVGQEGTC
jgi:hypothetical protein